MWECRSHDSRYIRACARHEAKLRSDSIGMNQSELNDAFNEAIDESMKALLGPSVRGSPYASHQHHDAERDQLACRTDTMCDGFLRILLTVRSLPHSSRM
jgi:hypothetical protein